MPWGQDQAPAGGWGKDPDPKAYAARKAPKGPNVAKDVGASFISGALSGIGQIADAVDPVNQMIRAFPGGPVAQIALKPLERFTVHGLAGTMGGNRKPQTTAGRYAKTIGEFAPNAAVGGSGGIVRRAAQVVVPAIASEAAGQAVENAGGNKFAQGAARFGGAVVGGVAAGARIAPRAPENRALNVFAARQGATPAEMTARANAFRANDIKPTLVDVTDDAGRGVIRATASRMTPARQAATDFRDARALNLPSRISRQARRTISADPRTPDEIRQATAAARSANADKAYGAVRAERIGLAPETVQALRTPHGIDAIREAARRERDPNIRAELNGLADAAKDNPGGTQITIGMADRIARTLHGKGQAASRQGDQDLAGFYHSLANDVRKPAIAGSKGYADAVAGYAADSQLHSAAAAGEDFMARNTDEFVTQVKDMTPEERALAQAAARRAVERKSGESIGAAPGVARALADTPEQQARNAALLGPDRAQAMQDGMRLEERAVRNANDIAPRTGTQTFNKGADDKAISNTLAVGRDLVFGNKIGLAARAIDWFRTRGLSDAEAQRLTEVAIDPNRLDEALRVIQARLGPRAARQFLDMRQRMLIGTSGALSMGASDAGR